VLCWDIQGRMSRCVRSSSSTIIVEVV
jgi:hypothetical protein